MPGIGIICRTDLRIIQFMAYEAVDY